MPRKPKEKKEKPAAKEVKKPVIVEPVEAPSVPVSKAADDDFVPEIPAEYADAGAGEVKKSERYFEAVGRRKTAIARVRMYTRSGDVIINGKKYGEYFPTIDLQKTVEDALQKMKLWGRFRVSVKVSGCGEHEEGEP